MRSPPPPRRDRTVPAPGDRRSVAARPAPLENLYDHTAGPDLPLPRALARPYGPFRLPRGVHGPYVVGNFASTLDGVVSLQSPGASSGGEITGFDPRDRLLMGILRAAADAVVVGAGTLRAVPRHVWTAGHVVPSLAKEFATLRRRLGKPPTPWNVVVTASGRLDLRLPLFTRREVPVRIVTTSAGARRLGEVRDLPSVDVTTVPGRTSVRAVDVLRAIRTPGRGGVVLVEGGPHLIGSFFAERRLDELFLTLAPQVAGRDRITRPGLVAGHSFAPEHPLWGSLVGVRRGGSLLFLRFTFAASPRPPGTSRRRLPRRPDGRR